VAGYTKMVYPETVTHPSINRAQSRGNYVDWDQYVTFTKPGKGRHTTDAAMYSLLKTDSTKWNHHDLCYQTVMHCKIFNASERYWMV